MEEPTILDPGLPHGRLWVAQQGCDCTLCQAALERAEADRQARDRAAQPLPPRNQHIEQQRWSKARWTKTASDTWAILAPVGVHKPGDTIDVHNTTTGVVRRVKLGWKAPTPREVAPGVWADFFFPDRRLQT